MNIKDLQKPLPIESIDFRVQSINKGGYATILAYKDARVDMNILDTVVGPLNWKKEYTRDNKNCIVSIYDEAKKEWISKEDTGTESNTEQEKGLASDSFKRACFNWGIGRELYDYPVIQVKLEGGKIYQEKNGTTYKVVNKEACYDEWYIEKDGYKEYPKSGYGLKLKEWKWVSKFDDKGKLLVLACKDNNGKLRFSYGDLNLLK